MSTKIHNHYASTLSELDLLICRSVPPGGNWKNIPADVPSKRIQNIRTSFAEGKGSRSTYYGRLHPSRPSYTINTYFSRPGNGCHIHYDFESEQHRTISHREAARLQSFPDNFVFLGSKTSVGTQIGNAVPPLLAFQIAQHLPMKGQFVDLFAGAGGLGFGFKNAGWKPVAANELDKNFAQSYMLNVHEQCVIGDIRIPENKAEIIKLASSSKNDKLPLFVLGGPPCQGYSTAGNKRTMEDPRNWLFSDYCDILKALSPDGFVFENVTGLINMQGGQVLEMVKSELSKYADRLIIWKLDTENYGIPQRRSRLIIIGDNTGLIPMTPPNAVSSLGIKEDMFTELPRTPSVKEALDDLPSLIPGEDGSSKSYRNGPTTAYQRLMRGLSTPQEYIYSLSQSSR
jgi:DNA (cytosine-5)-methyltransferase 1